jgi:chromatin structure-remodeling complex subunit RSC1/2
VPEEVRKKEEFMPIYPFEKTLMPERFPSPFLGKGAGGSGKKWPGGILPDAIGVEKVVKEEEKVGGVTEVARKRPRRAAAAAAEANKGGTNIATPSSLATQYQPSSLTQQAQIPGHPRPDRSVVTAAGGLAVLGQGAHIEKLPAETGMWAPCSISSSSDSPESLVAKHFDRDPETNEVLWFPAPPVDVPRRATPKYSLAYLHFLATKGKRELAEDGGDGDAMDVDEHEEPESSTHAKRARLEGLPSVTETLRALIRRTTMET